MQGFGNALDAKQDLGTCAVPKRGRSKRGRTQKPANADAETRKCGRRNPQMRAKERKCPQKSANASPQKSARERFHVKIADNQVCRERGNRALVIVLLSKTIFEAPKCLQI